jgi:hypothetical protein
MTEHAIYVSRRYINDDDEVTHETPIGRWFGDRFGQEIGDLFKGLQHTYGKCVKSHLVKTDGRHPVKVGWVFEKLVQYYGSLRPRYRRVEITLWDIDDIDADGHPSFKHHILPG